MSVLRSESVVERHAPLARVAEPQVELVGKSGRFVLKIEAAQRVAHVEDIASPDARAPALPFITKTKIHERVGVRALIVARIEIEIVLAGDIGTREPAVRMTIAERQRV